MNHVLSPELEASIAAHLATGRYRSGNEVLVDAMSALEERDRKYEELRREIQLGIDDLEAGRVSTKTAREMLEEIRKEKSLAKSTTDA